MCFLMSFIPATFFVILGYFVLFSSTKVKGGVSTFGKILATWIFIIALFFPLMGAYATISGECPMIRMMRNVQQKGGLLKMMQKEGATHMNHGREEGHRGPMHH